MAFRTVARRGYYNLNKRTWQETVVSLVPTGSIVWRLNNTTTITNLKGNSLLNGTVQGTPSLIASPFGNDQGLALNANGKKVIISTNATLTALANASSYTVMIRFRIPAGNTTRTIYNYANSANHLVNISTLDKLVATRGAASVAASAVSTPSITEGANNWIACVFNPADKPNQFRMYQGTVTLSEMALTTDVAASGALTSFAGQQFNMGDRTLNDVGLLAEMADLFIYTPNGLTLADMTKITDVTPD